MDNLKYSRFADINLNDPFFDSLKADYQEFATWFAKKSDHSAYVLYDENGQSIEGFMYVKTENGVSDITPPLNDSALKIGTFKFNPKQTLRGHRFLKKALDIAIHQNLRYVYLTVFPKHEALIKLITTYGFFQHGIKESSNGTEYVYVRDLANCQNDPIKDYPLIQTENVNKYLLSIYPEYHSRLFPESVLHNESPDIVQDVSHANSIQKIYLSAAHGATELKKGDLLVIYRTSDKQGPAAYRSVATGVCTVLKTLQLAQFQTLEKYLTYCERFSVFSKDELFQYYKNRRYPYIIQFAFNLALPKRPIRQVLVSEVGLSENDRWTLLPITDGQFHHILQLGKANENFIINQT